MFCNGRGCCAIGADVSVCPIPHKKTRTGRKSVRKCGNLLDGSDVRGADGDEEDIAKLSGGDAHDATGVLGQDADFRPEAERVDLVVVAGNLFPPFDGALDGRVVSVVVLRRQAEAGDGAVGVLLADGRVLHEVADREVLPFDPDRGCLSEVFVDDDSGVGDNSGFGLSVCQGLEKASKATELTRTGSCSW